MISFIVQGIGNYVRIKGSKGRGRLPRCINILLLFILLITICTSEDQGNFVGIKDNLKKCDKATARLVNIENDCIIEETTQTDFPELENYLSDEDQLKWESNNEFNLSDKTIN